MEEKPASGSHEQTLGIQAKTQNNQLATPDNKAPSTGKWPESSMPTQLQAFKVIQCHLQATRSNKSRQHHINSRQSGSCSPKESGSNSNTIRSLRKSPLNSHTGIKYRKTGTSSKETGTNSRTWEWLSQCWTRTLQNHTFSLAVAVKTMRTNNLGYWVSL